MKLILSDGSTPYSTYFRTEDGQPMYRTGVTSSNSFTGGSSVSIHKIPLGQGASISPNHKGHLGLDAVGYELATFKIRGFHKDEFTINGKEFTEKDFFKKRGIRWYGRDRIWQGPDGKEYRWEMGVSKPELFLNDKSKTVVAKFHREHSGFLGVHEKTPANLEILVPCSEELLDIILVTFVYMEKNRADREKAMNKQTQGNFKTGIENLAGP